MDKLKFLLFLLLQIRFIAAYLETPKDWIPPNAVDRATWDCESREWYKETLTRDEQRERNAIFQEWLNNFQNDCSRSVFYDKTIPGAAGIGSSLNGAVVNFGRSLQMNQIYKPKGNWIWAGNSTRCGGATSLDCFFKDFSTCDVTKKDGVNGQLPKEFNPVATDVCTISATARMPVIWLFGQLLTYITRLDEVMEFQVNSFIESLYKENGLSKDMLYLSAHIRRGTPDGNRRHVPLEDYFNLLNSQVSLSLDTSTPISFIYASGDNIYETLPVSFNYSNLVKVIRPKFTVTKEKESEWAVRANKDLAETLVIEFLVDIKMYMNSFSFIGVHSNVWAVVYPLRLSNGLHSSCMFDTHKNPFLYLCNYCDRNFWYPAFRLSC